MNTPAAIQRIVRANNWTPEHAARVLAYAAYTDDVELLEWVLEETQMTKAGMAALEFRPLFVAAANDRLHALDALVKHFNVLDAADAPLRAALLGTAIQCGAVGVLAHMRDSAGMAQWAPDATHPAISAGIHAALTEFTRGHRGAVFKDVLECVLNDVPGLTLTQLHQTGIMGRLLEHGAWYLLRAALRLPEE